MIYCAIIAFFLCFVFIFYISRHTWATIAFHQETPVGVISRGLGHSSVKVTETYLKPFGDKEVDRTNRKILNYVLSAV